MAKNIIEFSVEWGESDTAGIVFYPNYFRWFDRATHTLLKSIGLPVTELQEKYNFAQPIIDTGCRFFSPLRYDDDVRIESVVVEVRERTFRIEHKVYKGETLVGNGFEARAWIRTDQIGEDGKLKAVAIPPGIVEKLKG